jgi:hypothetical protein
MKQNDETSYNCIRWDGEGVVLGRGLRWGGDGGGDLTSVQFYLELAQ